MNINKLYTYCLLMTVAALELTAANTFPASGNVGIGTAAPGGMLEIKGSGPGAIRIQDTANLLGFGSNADGHEFNIVGGIPDGSNMGGHIRLGGSTRGDTNINGIIFIQNAIERMRIANGGNVGIGTNTPSHKLSVNGSIRAKEIIVDTGWADYVFSRNYRLAPLAEVAQHIQINGCLPDVPSAKEVAERGLSLGESQALLLRKIEELTLHMIAHEKSIEALKAENTDLKEELRAMRVTGVK